MSLSASEQRIRVTRQVLTEVGLERDRQENKWGEQNHDPFIWMAVLGEEVGEVSEAALKATFSAGSWRAYRAELVQVAAVAVAMIECLDRHDGAPPEG